MHRFIASTCYLSSSPNPWLTHLHSAIHFMPQQTAPFDHFSSTPCSTFVCVGGGGVATCLIHSQSLSHPHLCVYSGKIYRKIVLLLYACSARRTPSVLSTFSDLHTPYMHMVRMLRHISPTIHAYEYLRRASITCSGGSYYYFWPLKRSTTPVSDSQAHVRYAFVLHMCACV